jgi:hypothetical protein
MNDMLALLVPLFFACIAVGAAVYALDASGQARRAAQEPSRVNTYTYPNTEVNAYAWRPLAVIVRDYLTDQARPGALLSLNLNNQDEALIAYIDGSVAWHPILAIEFVDPLIADTVYSAQWRGLGS